MAAKDDAGVTCGTASTADAADEGKERYSKADKAEASSTRPRLNSTSEKKETEKQILPGLENLLTQGKKSFGARETYELEEVLGEGSYGSVYRCHRVRDGAVYAVKIIDPVRLGFVGGEHAVRCAEAMAVREVNALRQLAAHPGVISLEAAFYSESTRQVFIVTDYLAGDHLFSHIVRRTHPLQEAEAAHIVGQVSDALSFCHCLGLVHRDLKLENILVASIDMTLVERAIPPDFKQMSWSTREVFTVKLCDFGFAKSLKAFTTRTPIGTLSYAAPEIDLDAAKERRIQGLQTAEAEADYDAFKADAYSLGIMVYVMLCLAFPAKDEAQGAHRSRKHWGNLTDDAKSLIDGLLEVDPRERLSLQQVCQHKWLTTVDWRPKAAVKDLDGIDEGEIDDLNNDGSEPISATAPNGGFGRQTTAGIAANHKSCPDDPVLNGVLALHRALVHIQQERSMALFALAGSPGLQGVSDSWDQFQWHIELTEKRVHEAQDVSVKCLSPVERRHLDEALLQIGGSLRLGRQLSHSALPVVAPTEPVVAPIEPKGFTAVCIDTFDGVFAAYNCACMGIVDEVARCVQSAKPGSPEGRRAARRYRLFASAAEQLSRERAFMCGHVHLEGDDSNDEGLPRGMLERLSQIIGSRKILLGTAVGAGYTVATSTGLLGALIGEGEPSLLSTGDVGELEALETKVLAPCVTGADARAPSELHWKLTRLLNEIHSRVAVSLVQDMRIDVSDVSDLSGRLYHSEFEAGDEVKRHLSTIEEDIMRVYGTDKVPEESCGCRSGLKMILQKMLDSL